MARFTTDSGGKPSPTAETRTAFERLRRHFDQIDRESGVYSITAVGEFIPSSLRLVDAAVRKFFRLGLLHPHALFLDAGCGDARIVALMALIHGLPAVGIEYDEDLCRRAREQLRRLPTSGATTPVHMQVVAGDFTRDATYLAAGHRFEDFKTIFNYINNHHDIAEKISRQSPSGTRFLLYYPSPHPEPLDGLLWEQSYMAGETTGTGQSLATGTSVHLYRKP